MGEIRPILKWAGGKAKLLPEIRAMMPEKFGTYYEPFLGGAAVLFGVRPVSAVVNDINPELMNLYRVVMKDPQGLIRLLKEHKANDSKEHFYAVREEDRDEFYRQRPAVERAARIVYLNKTCFNGLFRTNKDGYFNVPYGKYKDPLICDEENILAVSEYFNDAFIMMHQGDFENVLAGVSAGDFVYMDPPCASPDSAPGFTGCASMNFTMDDQRRLKETCDRLTGKGVMFLQSNSCCDAVMELYKDYDVRVVTTNHVIGRKGDSRGVVEEVLISNYAKGD